MSNIIKKVKVEKSKVHYTTKLDKWLKGKTLDFYPTKEVTFYNAVEAIVEFDKDHTISIILPKEVFETK